MRAALVLPVLLAAASADYQSAQRKLSLIEKEALPANALVSFTLGEINEFARGRLEEAVPGAVRDPRLRLGPGTATGYAHVDFDKLRAAQAGEGSFLSRLLGGERPVAVAVRVRSAGGECRVDVERVEISGIAIQGAALEFLVEQFLLPRYPEAKIGEPFALGHRVERIEVVPGGVRVKIGR